MAITGFSCILVQCYACKIFFLIMPEKKKLDHHSNIQVGSAICQDFCI